MLYKEINSTQVEGLLYYIYVDEEILKFTEYSVRDFSFGRQRQVLGRPSQFHTSIGVYPKNTEHIAPAGSYY